MTIPQLDALRAGALHITQTLQAKGYEAYWAGGCVRDHLLGRTPKDYDIATSALPDEVMACFTKTVTIGKAFGVIGVIYDGTLYEVATFRGESDYADGRHPDHIHFTNAQEDALRRDFTINALFYDPVNDEIRDYVGGRADIESRLIRAVGDPGQRFQEDHLRMMRAVRFAATLGYVLDPATRSAIVEGAHQIARISPERIRDELIRTLTEALQPGDALLMLEETGLLPIILPEVSAMRGVEQPPEFHPEGDVFVHTRLMLNAMNQPTPELALSVLLHDVGKPPTARIGPGRDGTDRIRFDGHDKVGADMTEGILRRLRFPNATIRVVTACVRNHMRFMHVQEMRRAKLRAMVAVPWFDTELELHRLDCLASHADLSNYAFMRRFQEEWRNEPVLHAPWIRGEDLIALGLPAGPKLGRLLKETYAQQLEGTHADRDELLAWVKQQLDER